MAMSDTDARDAALDGGRMTIWEHLAELRTRLIRCVIAITLGATVTWIFYERILEFLMRPYLAFSPDAKFIITEPMQAFALRIEISGYGGVVLGMGVILWQVWRFVTPGLYPHEKKYAVPFVVSSLLLFLLGASIAYFTLTPALQFLQGLGTDKFQTFYTPDSYVKLIALMMLAFGAGFEFPVLLVALQLVRVLTPKQLSGFRRQAIVVIAIVAAVITPSGDPISMLALAVPMYLFYEVSILIGWIFTRRRARAAAHS